MLLSKPRTKLIAPKAHLHPNLPTTTVLFSGVSGLRAVFPSFLRNVQVVVWGNIPPGPWETTTCQNLFSQMPGNTLLGCCFVNYISSQTFSSDRLLDDTGSTFGRCRIHFWDMENRTGFCFLSHLLSKLLSKVNFLSKPRTKIIAPKAHLQPNWPTTTVLFLGISGFRSTSRASYAMSQWSFGKIFHLDLRKLPPDKTYFPRCPAIHC